MVAARLPEGFRRDWLQTGFADEFPHCFRVCVLGGQCLEVVRQLSALLLCTSQAELASCSSWTNHEKLARQGVFCSPMSSAQNPGLASTSPNRRPKALVCRKWLNTGNTCRACTTCCSPVGLQECVWKSGTGNAFFSRQVKPPKPDAISYNAIITVRISGAFNSFSFRRACEFCLA